jgi:DNA-binding CsgD family transcriptional regulator
MTETSHVAPTRAFQALLIGPATLSAREHQIAVLASRGLSNRDIARQLRGAEGTVKFHMHNVLRKLDMKRRSELILALRPR